MINEGYAKLYCCEDISLIENYQEAISDETQMWVCHHRREISENKTKKELKAEGKYYKVLAEELIFLTYVEHGRLHLLGKPKSEKHKKHISEGRKGIQFSDKHREHLSEALTGRKLSAKQRVAMGEAMKLLKWFNNGEKNIRVKEAPDNSWKPGRLHYKLKK